VLASEINSAYLPVALAVNGTSLYFTANDFGSNLGLNGGVYTRPSAGGGTLTTIVATATGGPGPMAVNGTYVYWGEVASSTSKCAVVRAPKTGVGTTGEILTRLQNGASVRAVALDATHVYYGDSKGNVYSLQVQ
jgi:hypothetical protein